MTIYHFFYSSNITLQTFLPKAFFSVNCRAPKLQILPLHTILRSVIRRIEGKKKHFLKTNYEK